MAKSGCSAAWLARLNGVQEVVGSNPATPTNKIRGFRMLTIARLSQIV